MYKYNEIVECNGVYGRVIYHDPIKHVVHVLIRTNVNTWNIKKYDEFVCRPAQVFMWTIASAFCTKNIMKTPQLLPEYSSVDTDYTMEI
jgi:hypothetical protein